MIKSLLRTYFQNVESRIPDFILGFFGLGVVARTTWSLIHGQPSILEIAVYTVASGIFILCWLVHSRVLKLEEKIKNLANASDDKFLVVEDAVDQSAWSGFIDTYRAYNPTFGMDVEFQKPVIIKKERVLMHFNRYARGVNSAQYFLYAGPKDKQDSIERLILRNCLIFFREVEASFGTNKDFYATEAADWTFPNLNPIITIHLIEGPRSPISCFLGFKRSEVGGGKRKFGITYFTGHPSVGGANMNTPRLLTILKDQEHLASLETVFSQHQAQCVDFSLNEFSKYATSELGVKIGKDRIYR